jgi:microcystin-dependent protein
MSNPFLGEIRVFAGNFSPRSWAFCRGQLLPISQNDALYALLGTTFGGDGQVTFGLPDTQGRVVIGQGTGPGLSSYIVGQESGTESVTLTSNQLPQHTHSMLAYVTPATTSNPTNAVLAQTGITYPGSQIQNSLFYLSGTANTAGLPADTIQAAGGNQPHDNNMPGLVLNYIIALEGIFPSRN